MIREKIIGSIIVVLLVLCSHISYCGAEDLFVSNEESVKRIYLQEYPCRSFCADNNSKIYIIGRSGRGYIY